MALKTVEHDKRKLKIKHKYIIQALNDNHKMEILYENT